MYIRKQGDYKTIENKENGKVIWKISERKAKKVLDTFVHLSKAEQCEFLSRASKKEPHKRLIGPNSDDVEINVPQN